MAIGYFHLLIFLQIANQLFCFFYYFAVWTLQAFYIKHYFFKTGYKGRNGKQIQPRDDGGATLRKFHFDDQVWSTSLPSHPSR